MRSATDPALALLLLTACTPPEEEPEVGCTPLDQQIVTDCSASEPLPLLEKGEWDSVTESWSLDDQVRAFVDRGGRAIDTLYVHARSPEALAPVDGKCIVVNTLVIEGSALEDTSALRHFDVRSSLTFQGNRQLHEIEMLNVRSLQRLSVIGVAPGEGVAITRVALPNLQQVGRVVVPYTVCDLDLGAAQGDACAEASLISRCVEGEDEVEGVLERRTCCDGIFEGADEIRYP